MKIAKVSEKWGIIGFHQTIFMNQRDDSAHKFAKIKK